MQKRIFTALLSGLLFVQSASALDVSAKSAILYEPLTKTVLFEKNSHIKMEMASTTKIMTALVVLENASLSDVVSIPETAAGTEGTSMYLKKNERVSVSDLMYGLLLRSGNDAAMALASHVGDDDVKVFVDMMNATARKIGMNNTAFKNPSGLPADGHFSTAYDMALLTAKALENPCFSEIVSTREKIAAGRALTNHNKLLKMYDGANGVKTGYTKAAGRCLVSSAERNGMNLIAVTLSAPDDWDDHMKMLDYGFDNFKLDTYSTESAGLPDICVVGGTEESASADICGEISFLTQKGKTDGIKTEIFMPRFVYAPITRGDVIGEVRYISDGKVLGISSIVSGSTVKEYEKTSVIEKVFDFFRRQ